VKNSQSSSTGLSSRKRFRQGEFYRVPSLDLGLVLCTLTLLWVYRVHREFRRLGAPLEARVNCPLEINVGATGEFHIIRRYGNDPTRYS
jgi:hypothetical protein